jgi:UDP-arabinose 4-epimerase
MNVLVTGGAGYVGSHVCKALSRAGCQPVTLDNLTTGHEWAVRWGPLIHGGLENKRLLHAVFRRHRIDVVIHFAACAYVGESMRNPALYFQNNTVNTLNLLDVMREEGASKIVFSSTCATYGEPEQIPISEHHVQRPVNPYGESKLMIERILHWYGQCYGVAWTALRYFNAAGADPEAELGEDHNPETHLIPRAIDVALGKATELEIYGMDYDTPDGSALRDYVHVCDLSAAHLRAMQYLVTGGESVALNLGTGCGHSVLEVVSTLRTIAGREVPIKECPRRAGDPPALVADPRKAKKVLGWVAQHSSLQFILETAWRWQAGRSSGKHKPGKASCEYRL